MSKLIKIIQTKISMFDFQIISIIFTSSFISSKNHINVTRNLSKNYEEVNLQLYSIPPSSLPPSFPHVSIEFSLPISLHAKFSAAFQCGTIISTTHNFSFFFTYKRSLNQKILST